VAGAAARDARTSIGCRRFVPVRPAATAQRSLRRPHHSRWQIPIMRYTVVMTYLGACHCSAIGFTYDTALAPSAWPIRACACRFCRSHGAATTSDPAGAMQIVCRDPTQLLGYRFGLGTADFWLCRICGVYLGATTSDGRFGIINTNTLVDRSLPLSPAQAVSYDGETAGSRLARREQRWTPVRAAQG
jgi:hypothetical protein